MSIELTKNVALSFYTAANELYDMYVEAAEHIIANDLFFEMGIPFNLVEAIKKSWENDVHWHIYGAFVFEGGLGGEAISLKHFAADTPSYFLQTSQEQLKETQFNETYSMISENFKRLITLDDGLELFKERYDGWKILFSAPQDDEEKIQESQLLEQLAKEAGFETGFSYLHEVEFRDEGVFDANGGEYEYWFKNYSWIEMASQESELATTLTNLINNQKAIILNPAYTAVFESDGIINVLRELYPKSPYLQEAKSSSMYSINTFFAYEACGIGFVENNLFIPHEIV